MYSDFYSYGPGVSVVEDKKTKGGKVRFHFVPEEGVGEKCGVVLRDRTTRELKRRIVFGEQERVGTVYSTVVSEVDLENDCYQFFVGETTVPDRGGICFVKTSYGEPAGEEEQLACFSKSFDWKQDRKPGLPFEKVRMYCMHVRGFTAHASSGVKAPGTFAGVVEKIPYLKGIGITTLELQPIYQFLELEKTKALATMENAVPVSEERKLNYWGYKKGFYFAPKASYAKSEDSVSECKEMIRALHKNGMEVVLQIYFAEEMRLARMLEVLRFWTLEYHVDGFHLIGDGIPFELISKDPLLSDSKLFYHSISDRDLDWGSLAGHKHLGLYNDDYLYDCRKYLKGDAGMLQAMIGQLSYVPEKTGRIHYLTNYYGFTLNDLVTYTQKHNEANGEENRDGNDFNYSWNCGEEGPAKSRKLQKLRSRQIKNAMSLLLLSASTPLIFMGDEFGNTQFGNNNPYCQDNEITWLDWSLVKKNRGILEFWKKLVAFRESHPILHPGKPYRMSDGLSCGYPDLSLHGTNAWKVESGFMSRHFGVMLCEAYGEPDSDEEPGFLYLAINMSGEEHELGLPKLPGKRKWRIAFSTEETLAADEEIQENSKLFPGRSITVLAAGIQ